MCPHHKPLKRQKQVIPPKKGFCFAALTHCQPWKARYLVPPPHFLGCRSPGLAQAGESGGILLAVIRFAFTKKLLEGLGHKCLIKCFFSRYLKQIQQLLKELEVSGRFFLAGASKESLNSMKSKGKVLPSTGSKGFSCDSSFSGHTVPR